MFDNYRRLLDPPSLLDVAESEVLRSLMQAFFYRQRTGVAMLYDKGQPLEADGHGLACLEPFPPDSPCNREGFHPFCEAFRQDPQNDTLCREFDTHAVAGCYAGQGPGRIKCHMGLIDFKFPIRMGNRVRAVLLAGQRVPTWDPERMSYIEGRIRKEVPAPDAAQQLLDLLPTVMKEGISSKDEVDELELQFLAFGETFQKTVTALHQAKRGEALHEAIVEVTERLNTFVAPTSDDWITPTESVLAELEKLCGLPLVFFVRMGSRYFARAVSPLAQGVRGRDVSVPKLANLALANWTTSHPGDEYYKELSRAIPSPPAGTKFGGSRRAGPCNAPLWLYRFDTHSAKEVALSALLLVSGQPEPETQELLAASVRAIAYPAYVSILFDRLNAQRAQFIKDVTFTGHTLKTPITTALFQLRRLQQFADGAATPRHEVNTLVRSLRHQLLAAVHDAMALTGAAQAPGWVEVGGLLRELIPGFQAMGAGRSITLRFDDREAYHVRAVRGHLRIAFNNLLDNAVKYSFSSREVRIEVSKRRRDEVLFEISNFGVGFDEALKDQLFCFGRRLPTLDPRLDRHGSGLGLLHAKEFIEGCDGSIDIESHKIFEADPTDIRHLTIVKVLLPIRVDSL